MSMLFVNNPPPTPNVLTEELVNSRLAELDPHFFIKWVPTAYWNERSRRFEGRYALAQRWTSNDPRMAWVRENKQSIEDALDIWGWFCEDMHVAASVPKDPQAMMAKIIELVGKSDATRFPIRERLAQISAHNMRTREKVKEEALEEAMDVAKDSYWHSNRATRVFVDGNKKEAEHGTEE